MPPTPFQILLLVLCWIVCAPLRKWSVDEVLVTQPKEIFKLYAAFPFGGFWWDLLGLLPFDYCALAFHDPFEASFIGSE